MTGFEIAMLVQTGASILGAFTSEKEKMPVSFEEKRYNRVRADYIDIAKKVRTAQNVAAAFTGRPVSDFKSANGMSQMFDMLHARGWKMETQTSKPQQTMKSGKSAEDKVNEMKADAAEQESLYQKYNEPVEQEPLPERPTSMKDEEEDDNGLYNA